jgi:hypothetical protein
MSVDATLSLFTTVNYNNNIQYLASTVRERRDSTELIERQEPQLLETRLIEYLQNGGAEGKSVCLDRLVFRIS